MKHLFTVNGSTSLTLTPSTPLEESLIESLLQIKDIVIEKVPGTAIGLIIKQQSVVKPNGIGCAEENL